MVVQEDGKWLVLPEWRYDSAVQLNNNTRKTSRASSDTMLLGWYRHLQLLDLCTGWTSHCKPLDLARFESQPGRLAAENYSRSGEQEKFSSDI